MSTKKVWEIWVPGWVMEKISQEVPNVTARFFFNDFLGMWAVEPYVINVERLNEDNKWVTVPDVRWKEIGKRIYFNVDASIGWKKGYEAAIKEMIEYLKAHPRP